MINIFLDDERNTPEPINGVEWTRVYTASECIGYLNKVNEDSSIVNVNILSLDHDLGPDSAGTGYDVVCFLEEKKYNEPTFVLPNEIRVHSANPVGRQRMLSVIKRLYS